MSTILVIDDEKDIVEAIEYNFKKEGFKVNKAFDGPAGLKSAKEKNPDLIILDLMLPGSSGLEICRMLKSDKRTVNTPIIILTAKSEEVDKIVGFELGADDYLTKPFSLRELIARTKAVLKRSGEKPVGHSQLLRVGELEIDPEKHEVRVGGKRIELTAKEFMLLQFLVENQDRVFSREKLLDHVWGIEVAIETRTVDVHIRRLREKLGKAGGHITTLRGFGYKFS